ncbi:hypothetical protein EZ428_09335 [Pedobacter frigiditerrae]|uniref:Uncharacterized protein n=1 Tax=Pedobacter frigiditerrae TaxID=2530452 RepID=A0A4V2MIX9_9SPHI|nr:hypothetical protein [Pedobacter frigiditerrae]TCC91936.1 hypothetical protein EZ428_09335 [Pedobacter frigiditerrae]
MSTEKIIGFTLVMLTLSACKKPTENIKIILDTDVIKNTAMINVTDAQTGNSAPNDATITISGTQATDVYELSGKKDIKLSAGMVTIGLRPDIIPTADKPISIIVEINATGYNKQAKQVTFTAAQKQQVVNISITKTGTTAPPIVIPPPPVYNNTTLTFVGKCPNRTDLEIRPSVYVYFKKTSSTGAFQYLGYMEKGNITTNLLALNETYDFQIVYGGETYRTSQKIEQTSYNLTIEMPAACKF